MAGPNTNFNQLSATVRDHFLGKYRELVFNAAPALGMFLKGGSRPRGGAKIRQPVTYQQSKDGAFFDYATLPTAGEDKHTASEWEWKLYSQHFTISIPEIRRSSGPEAVYRLLDLGTKTSLSALRDAIATDMFYLSGTSVYGDSDAQIHSLPGLISNNTWPAAATIGNIPKSNSWWQGQVVDGGGSFDYTHLTELYWDCADGNDLPTAAFCHNVNADVIDDVAVTAGERFIRNPGQGAMNKFGVAPQITHVKGVPLYVDRHCDVDHVYMLRMEDFDLAIHKDDNFRFEGFKKPEDKYVQVGFWHFMGDLTVLDPRRSGVIYNVT